MRLRFSHDVVLVCGIFRPHIGRRYIGLGVFSRQFCLPRANLHEVAWESRRLAQLYVLEELEVFYRLTLTSDDVELDALRLGEEGAFASAANEIGHGRMLQMSAACGDGSSGIDKR